jgi:S1-C subfamily serine protease
MKPLWTHTLAILATFLIVTLWFQLRGVPRGGRPEQGSVGQASPERSWSAEKPPEPPPIPPDVLAVVDADEQVNIRVYEAANRSVVNITIASTGGFFGDELSTGTGSGFVIDEAGRILTNYHVIARAEALQVTLFDGTNYRAKVVGTDINNDVAVVEIDAPADKVVPLPLGDSSPLRVGQKVLALGNPFGLERTLTTGIISSLDRSIKSKNNRTIKGIIQTDAAINPGNSGGPLLNTRGQVIGMNTAILSSVGQSAGIGFAVPINTIKRVLQPLIETGHVVRADLGLREVFVTERGLYIVDLDEDGPAARAGLHPIQVVVERRGQFRRERPDPDSADRIIAIDGKPVHTVDDLLTEVEAHQPGDTVTVTTVRQGRKRDVKARLGATD